MVILGVVFLLIFGVVFLIIFSALQSARRDPCDDGCDGRDCCDRIIIIDSQWFIIVMILNTGVVIYSTQRIGFVLSHEEVRNAEFNLLFDCDTCGMRKSQTSIFIKFATLTSMSRGSHRLRV